MDSSTQSYLHHEEITDSFMENQRFDEVAEPVLHRAENNRDTGLRMEFLLDKAHVHDCMRCKYRYGLCRQEWRFRWDLIANAWWIHRTLQ